MNILLVNINLGTAQCVGGIETHSDILASALIDKGHNVIVGCWIDGTLITNTEGRAVRAKRITIRNSGDIKAIIKMAAICRNEDIDVIIANSGREYWPAAIAAKIAGARVILVRHMGIRLKKTTAWMINKMVDKVIAVSSSVKDLLIESGVSPEMIEVVLNGIPLRKLDPLAVDRTAAREEFAIKQSDIVIGAVGALHKGKGVYELLDAVNLLLKSHPELKLMFVGDGQERDHLKEKAAQSSMENRVIFTGIRRDVERMYSAMDIFVLPSTCEEAFGMVIIEAMAMRKPVIGTAVGGIPEIIEDGTTGTLVPPGNVPALVKAISRYIRDRQFSIKVATAGQDMVKCKFSEAIMGDNFSRVLIDVVGNQ